MKQDHVILNYQNQPMKLLKWPISTVATVVVPTPLLMLFGRPLLGVVLSILTGVLIREYEKRFGAGSLIGLCYWIFPHQKKRMPMTPPSHIREYIR